MTTGEGRAAYGRAGALRCNDATAVANDAQADHRLG